MSAATLSARDVAIFISSTGRPDAGPGGWDDADNLVIGHVSCRKK